MKNSGHNDSLLVAKAGGSLTDVISGVTTIFKDSGRRVLIVPGGGVFADTVRELDPKPDAAHWMAILGMEQYGHYISSFGVQSTENPCETKGGADRVRVLLPYRIMREKDPLPHSWDVTSDSIAAWVAETLSADLLVLKSTDGLKKNGSFLKEVCAEEEFEEVDPYFLHYVLEKNIDTWVVNARKPEVLKKFLSGEDFFGTHVHGKFLRRYTPNL
ncbi:aspartokinase-like uncharacterized kinase [Methanomicrobium sp. W14]|uniref:amino acid kinase family protein n=1 Tax=Methanomicrobium sp. W14 TaxID=2817839 RepID=UPI001AEB7B0E|nr:uridylate kinase [Methanomicrobium sp. W14]MBP2133444.1 aspartokinase-like uncharacterized kinase [Methanomicrobium sp. W14]